jgi:hypothetical protein
MICVHFTRCERANCTNFVGEGGRLGVGVGVGVGFAVEDAADFE